MHCTHWITNLDKNIEWKELSRRYTAADFPFYDNYPAINVDRVEDIPGDFPGLMGVPTMFLYCYNREQFEIVDRPNYTYISGRKTFQRIIIRNKHPLGEHPAGAEERKESWLLWETTHE